MLLSFVAFCRLTIWLMGAGTDVDSVCEQKKLEARKMLDAKCATREAPQRPVHITPTLLRDALLGGAIDIQYRLRRQRP